MWSSNQGINQLAWFTPYANRYLLALYRRKLLPSFISSKKKLQLLNMLRCESHRDLCINILSKRDKCFYIILTLNIKYLQLLS